jgi:hypothetical protein
VTEAGPRVSEQLHPAAPHHLPGFITAPGDTDVLMVVVGIVLVGSVLAIGNIYLHLHTLPERMAHRSQKLQFEIVAVLGLLALFTHLHLLLGGWMNGPGCTRPKRGVAPAGKKRHNSEGHTHRRGARKRVARSP